MPAFTTTAKLRFYDMDRAGMVFHGAYARIFQDAFEDLMEEIRFVEKDLEDDLGIRVPVVRHEMRFPAPPRGDELEIRVAVDETGTSSARFELVAYDASHGHEVARATVTRVSIDAEGDPVPIPEPLLEAWSRFEQDAQAAAPG